MPQADHPDLFDDERQGDLFGAESVAYRPDPDKVRARLHKILAEARAADAVPWGPTRLSLYRTIVPQMAGFLPDEEGAQLRFGVGEELAGLESALPPEGTLCDGIGAHNPVIPANAGI